MIKILKKIYVIISVVFLTCAIFVLWLYCLLQNNNYNNRLDAQRIVKDKYDLINVYFVNHIPIRDATLKEKDTNGRIVFYVLGENKYGDELFILVPHYKHKEPYLIEWPFKNSFKDMIQKLDTYSDNFQVSKLSSFFAFKTKKEGEKSIDDEFDLIHEDVNFLITFGKWLIVEYEDEIIIYGPGFKEKKA